jgi:two-component system response regulator RegX3
LTKVLVVEDEKNLREPLVYLLEKEGYQVVAAESGTLALEVFRSANPDLILLDLMLPGINGNEVCRLIRAESSVPIIMLTAKDTEIDKVVGLEIGADDYVTKPYSTRELLARMKAILRRGQQPQAPSEGVLSAGSVVMNLDRHIVEVNGEAVQMPLKEFELLELLLENVNRVLTRGQIIDRVWGANYFGDTKTLDVHVKRIRSKIEDDPARPRHLLTVRGLGYKFEA